MVEDVKRYFRGKVFATIVPRNVRLSEAPSHGLPIHLYDPRCTGTEAYRALAQELIERVGGGVTGRRRGPAPDPAKGIESLWTPQPQMPEGICRGE